MIERCLFHCFTLEFVTFSSKCCWSRKLALLIFTLFALWLRKCSSMMNATARSGLLSSVLSCFKCHIIWGWHSWNFWTNDNKGLKAFVGFFFCFYWDSAVERRQEGWERSGGRHTVSPSRPQGLQQPFSLWVACFTQWAVPVPRGLESWKRKSLLTFWKN